MKLTERQQKMLAYLERTDRPEQWHRPMDLGGSNGSYHSAVLRQLAAKGLIEQRRRCVSIQGALGSLKAGFEYRPLNGQRTSAFERE